MKMWRATSLSVVILTSLIFSTEEFPAIPRSARTHNEQASFLKQFGYLDEDTTGNSPREKFTNALRQFQTTWSLQASGKVDEQTIELMNNPRCGVNDKNLVGKDGQKRRSKREEGYTGVPGVKWYKKQLTYNIIEYPTTLTVQQVDETIQKALDEWARVTPLTFTRVSSMADIDIRFARNAHCNYGQFYGTGYILAHAFMPQFPDTTYPGDVHFDDSEEWRIGYEPQTVDLYHVALHEFGHSLGLNHSQYRGNVMSPYYRYQDDWHLQDEDIHRIQYLYGDESDSTALASSTFCQDSAIDAITSNVYKELFVFKDSHFAIVGANGVMDGYPKQIQTEFPMLPSSIDAAVFVPRIYRKACNSCPLDLVEEEGLYLFKGAKYYLFASGILSKDTYSTEGNIVDKFGAGIPSDVDAVFTVRGFRLYFTKGNSVWRSTRGKATPSIDRGYPHPLSDYATGLPSTGFQAVFNFKGAMSTFYNYFFTGQNYYQVSIKSGVKQLDEGSPMSSAQHIFNCANAMELEANAADGNSSETILGTTGMLEYVIDDVFIGANGKPLMP